MLNVTPYWSRIVSKKSNTILHPNVHKVLGSMISEGILLLIPRIGGLGYKNHLAWFQKVSKSALITSMPKSTDCFLLVQKRSIFKLQFLMKRRTL